MSARWWRVELYDEYGKCYEYQVGAYTAIDAMRNALRMPDKMDMPTIQKVIVVLLEEEAGK